MGQSFYQGVHEFMKTISVLMDSALELVFPPSTRERVWGPFLDFPWEIVPSLISVRISTSI
jgi:hypothetical protein